MFSANIAKLICFFTSHQYRGDIRVADKKRCKKDVCYTFLQCNRCGKLLEPSTSSNHQFGDFVASGNEACTLIRTCKKCGLEEKKEKHGEFETIQLGQSCNYKQVCKICGAKVGETSKHGSTHAAESSNPCVQNRICDQCGKVIGEIDKHDYGMPFDARFPVDPDDYYIAKAVKCKLCGYRKQI